MIEQVHLLNGGSCRHLAAAIDGRSLRFIRFHAVFLALRHSRLGWIICDSGYSDAFFSATARWPYRLYRWATPVSLRESTEATLRRIGIEASEIRHVIVTHFHADHIGGLKAFPNARFYYREDALAPLLRLTPFRQTRSAFLPSLLPPNLVARSEIVPIRSFAMDSRLGFPTHDLFGDGSLTLVYLPGHAPGQVGLAYSYQEQRRLYCADAFWHSMQIENAVDLPSLILKLQWDKSAYRQTVSALRVLAAQKQCALLSCHDEKTQDHAPV